LPSRDKRARRRMMAFNGPEPIPSQDSGESPTTGRTAMTIRLIVISMALFGTLQLSAQDWSAWTASNNRDFQYRWSGNAPSESGACYLELRDLKIKPNETTLVSVLIDYKAGQAESTRDVITIMGSHDEDQGPLIVRPCASVGGVRVNDMVRCETSGCHTSGWLWL